jgi:hypothetical protein
MVRHRRCNGDAREKEEVDGKQNDQRRHGSRSPRIAARDGSSYCSGSAAGGHHPDLHLPLLVMSHSARSPNSERQLDISANNCIKGTQMNENLNELNLEMLESRLEMETTTAAAPWLPIECWCD